MRKINLSYIVILAFVLFVSRLSLAEIITFVDDKGIVHYENRKSQENHPPEKKPSPSEVIKLPSALPLSPDKIHGLAAWFKLDNAAPAKGHRLEAWLDATKYAHMATQFKPEQCPKMIENGLNGRPVLRFDGKNDFLLSNSISASLNQAKELTVIYVSKSKVPNKKHYVWAIHGENQDLDIARGGYSKERKFRIKSTEIASLVDYNDSKAGQPVQKFAVFTSTFTTKRASLHRNGVYVINDEVDDPINFHKSVYFSLGQEWDKGVSTDFFNGDIAEIIVYNRALKQQERRSVESYLYHKFKLQEDSTIKLEKTPVKKNAVIEQKGDSFSANVNFHLVDSFNSGFEIYRSGNPTDSDIRKWCKAGIQEVMVLAGNAKGRELRFKKECPGLKVVYNNTQNVYQPVTRGFLEFFDKWVTASQAAGKKILFRCMCGCHRAGRLAAYYEIKYSGASVEETLINLYRYGKNMDKYLFLTKQLQGMEDYINSRPCRFSGQKKKRYCVQDSDAL